MQKKIHNCNCEIFNFKHTHFYRNDSPLSILTQIPNNQMSSNGINGADNSIAGTDNLPLSEADSGNDNPLSMFTNGQQINPAENPMITDGLGGVDLINGSDVGGLALDVQNNDTFQNLETSSSSLRSNPFIAISDLSTIPNTTSDSQPG